MLPNALQPDHWHAVDWSIIGPAWLAGLLVLSTHVPLGQRVLKKGIVFIDLAVAQMAGLGVILANVLGWDAQGWRVQAAAVGAALLGAGLLNWMEKRWPDIQEALIGALFVLASCLGILLLADNPHGGEHLKDLLVGQILWVSAEQLLPQAALSACVLSVWLIARQRIGQMGFYMLFAIAVTASVQLVGVYLVFSSLIMPALAVRHAPKRWQLAWAWGVGIASYGVGLSLSAMLDWPSGAVVVVAMASLCMALSQLLPTRTLKSTP